METISPNGIYLDAMKMDFHELVRVLIDNVGATVVQTMAGVRDRTSPYEWAKPDGPIPGRSEVIARVRLGYQVWRTLEHSQGPDVALAWLMGSNPRLNDGLPVLYIQRQLGQEVLGAAEAFVHDTFAA